MTAEAWGLPPWLRAQKLTILTKLYAENRLLAQAVKAKNRRRWRTLERSVLPGAGSPRSCEQRRFLARNEKRLPGPSFNAGSARAAPKPLQGDWPEMAKQPRALSKQLPRHPGATWGILAR